MDNDVKTVTFGDASAFTKFDSYCRKMNERKVKCDVSHILDETFDEIGA